MHTLPLIHQVLSKDQKKHFLAIETLNQIFYEHYAAAFHSTRAFGWRGWRSLLELHTVTQLAVVDIGCGSGRLADFIQRIWVEEQGQTLTYYYGLERSHGLLNHAKQRVLQIPVSWHHYDWSSEVLNINEVPNGFDWATLFGVMHHIYSQAARVYIIECMAKTLKVGGILSVSHWDFGSQDRYKNKKLEWDLLLKSKAHLSADLIEEGDFLLGWAGDVHIPRFCHWVSPSEETEWLQVISQRVPQLSKPIITTIAGDQNRYISWRLLDSINPT